MGSPARFPPPRLLSRLLPRFRHPAQTIVAAFAAAVLLGTGLLMLPAATTDPGGTSFMTALFTATSAVCVTGLAVVDTATHWSSFGAVVMLLLVQLGGFGIMTFATLLGLLVARRMGLRSRMQAAAESGTLDVSDLRRVLFGVAKITFTIELATAVLLALRWGLGYGEPVGQAIWLGVYHSVMSFNNAGFALWSNNLVPFASDPWICLPVAGGVILGGLGFPVMLELRREFGRPLHWSLNTKLVLSVTAVLLAAGTLFITALEWSNPATLGPLSPPARVLAGFFQATIARTAGFNSVDIGQLDPTTWFGLDLLMFIGAGPAGTGGGIKVTTFAVLFFLVVSEIRGEGSVNIFGRRLPRSAQRQAISVVALASVVVVAGTMALMLIEGLGLDRSLFEVISAFATVGLSTGITPQLSAGSQAVLVFLMFAGRLGPITLASAIALRRTTRLYEYPEERPIIG